MKNLILGNKRFQPFFEVLLKVAVKGMNLDRGHAPGLSGEKYVLKLVQELNPGKALTIFDVGANTGQYARLVIDTVQANCELYAFEPQPAALRELEAVSDEPSFYPVNLAMGRKGAKREFFTKKQEVCLPPCFRPPTITTMCTSTSRRKLR